MSKTEVLYGTMVLKYSIDRSYYKITLKTYIIFIKLMET